MESTTQAQPLSEEMHGSLPANSELRARAYRLKQAGLAFFSFPVLMGAVLVMVVVVVMRLRMPDPDTWWHFTVGEQILRTHHFPTRDQYSFTAFGQPWIAYEWLGEVLMALAARAGVLQGLTALLLFLTSLLTLLVYAYGAIRSGKSKAAAIATLVTLPLATVDYSMRPQLIGYIFVVITFICLELFQQGRRTFIWVLPPLFVIWGNTHGTFAFGLALIGLHWFCGLFEFHWGGLTARRWTERERLSLEIVFLLCLLALTITPYGTRPAAYPLEMAALQPTNIASIQEWEPLGSNVPALRAFLGFFFVFYLTSVAVRFTYRLDESLFFLFSIYAASVHIRFTYLFIMALVPLAATLLARWVPAYHREKDHPLVNALLMLAVGVGVVKLFPTRDAIQKEIDKTYPTVAVEYLRFHPHPARIFHDYGWGGFLIWQMGPEQKVFIDGRADFYEYAGVFTDYNHIVGLSSDAFQLIHKDRIEAFLLPRDYSLAIVLHELPGWNQVYADKLCVFYIRQPAGGAVRASPPSGHAPH